MASGKRQPSKQKRAAQNRAQRTALAARRDAASSATTTSAGRATATGGRGGLLGRLRGGSGSGGGVRAAAGAGGSAQPVGYRAALSALLMALAGVLFAFTLNTPVDADDEPFTRESLAAAWAGQALDAAAADPGADPAELAEGIDDWTPGRGETSYALALWPFSLMLGLPVIGAGLGFRAVAKRSSSRLVSRALFATLLGSLLSPLQIFFLPSVVALGVAVFQLRRYETTIAHLDAAETGSDGGVIEVDVVDDDRTDTEIDPVADDVGGTAATDTTERVDPARSDQP